MTVPSLDEVVETYGHATAEAIASGESQLIETYWLKDLVPLLIEAFPRIARSNGRIAILARLLRFTRERAEIVPLAIGALSDRAYLVRELACSILAYSLRTDAIPHLQSLAMHRDERTRADALAAIDAIAHQNQHYYVDRNHTGSARWIVKAGDLGAGSGDSLKPKALRGPA